MKEAYEKKTETIKIRVNSFDKKLIKLKAEESGLSISEYLLRSALHRKISVPITTEQLEVYKDLKTYQTNFSRLSNLIRENDQNLYYHIKNLIGEIGEHLKRIKNG